MKFLIIPGFAKSGTTFLFEQLAKSGAPINVPKRKEVDYFRSATSLEGYLDQFETQDPDKVFLDASPLYGLPGSDTASVIKKALKGHDVKIIFCLREALSRAYSHYMHDISTHFFLYGHGPYSFHSAAVLKKYFHPLAPVVRDYVKVFGKANVSGFGFKSTGPKLDEDVLDFLSLSQDWELDFSVNPAAGASIPRLYYDADRYLTVRSGKELYSLPPKTFLMANIRYQQYRPDFPSKIAALLMKNAASWDRQFDPAVLGAAINPIRQDYLDCFKVLGVEPEAMSPPKVIYAKDPPPLSPDICAKMEKLGSISATIVDSFQNRTPEKKTLFKKNNQEKSLVALDQFGTIPEIVQVVNGSQGKSNGKRIKAYEYAISELGPVPDYVKAYLRHQIQIGEAGAAVDYLKKNPNLQRYISFKVVLNDLEKFKHLMTQKDFETLSAYMGGG